MAGILSISSIFYLCFQRKKVAFRSLINILLGLFTTILPSIILKIYFTPPSRNFSLSFLKGNLEFFNLKSYVLIINYFFYSGLNPEYYGLWILFFIMSLLNSRKFFFKEIKIMSLFLFLFFLILIFVYLMTTNEDLLWRLETSFHRILIYLIPTFIFINFYTYWRSADK